MKVETYTDRSGREWDLHRIPQFMEDLEWYARRQDDRDGDDACKGQSRAEVVRAIEAAAPDSKECPACYGDLTIAPDGRTCRCDDCGAIYPVEWDQDGDSEGSHWSWGRDGVVPVVKS